MEYIIREDLNFIKVYHLAITVVLSCWKNPDGHTLHDPELAKAHPKRYPLAHGSHTSHGGSVLFRQPRVSQTLMFRN